MKPHIVKWWSGWTPLVLLPVMFVGLAPSVWPKWLFMWGLAFAIYVGCKWLTWRRTPIVNTTLFRQLGYLFLWPGLDAAAFLNPDRHPARPSWPEWCFAFAKTALGVVLIFEAARSVADENPLLVGWVGMIGSVFALHFGIFHLLSCAWRQVEVEAKPLMNWPVLATSVSDFWGRRWNTAFRDLTHRFLFRPLVARLGARGAVLVGFLFSGVVHEVVISFPAGGGYGGPTLFFALQGVALLVERSAVGRRMGLGSGFRGRFFTGVVLLAPVYVLFHPPFVLEIIVPFLGALGELRWI